MASYNIVITETPTPQGRPRLSKSGHVWSPNKPEKDIARGIIKRQVNECLSCPVSLIITFFMPIPKSTSKKKREEMKNTRVKHVKTPDVDNLLILLMNCMTGIVYNDDRQVWSVQAEKIYDENPRTEIIVQWSDEPDYEPEGVPWKQKVNERYLTELF